MWTARTWLRVRRPVCRDADARVDLAQQLLARLERGLLARQLVLHALLRVVPVELRELEQQRARRLLVQVGALAQDGCLYGTIPCCCAFGGCGQTIANG